MSVIIRLQNLPITAKSADIRNFFGGVHIPDGGVHILGGKNGGAFIGFNSDKDAYFAMQKDGEKINDSRIKLFLSSPMEMQYEVEKLKKCGIDNSPSHKSYRQERTLANEDSRYISSERLIDSQNPFQYGEQSVDHHINLVQHDQAPQSPVEFGSSSQSRLSRKRSRSSQRSESSSKTQSPQTKDLSRKRLGVYQRMPNYVNLHQIDLKQDKLDSSDLKNCNSNSESKPSLSEIQAELERRITEAIEKNSAIMAGGSMEYKKSGVPGFPGENMHVDYYQGHPCPEQNVPSATTPINFQPLPPPFLDNVQPFHAPEFQHSHVMSICQRVVAPPILHPDVLMASDEVGRQRNIKGFYVTISGLDTLWDFKEIQIMLNGIFVPQGNIRWEIDDAGLKTGTAFVKLMNRDEFDKVVRRMPFYFNNHLITVSECPDFLSYSYFSSVSEYQNEYMQQNHDMCYKLKGLPFACTCEDIIKFFQGFVVADVIITYGKDKKATGTGFVSFSNQKDYEQAFQLNGKNILHRYIEMVPCSKREMMKVKRMHPSAQTFTSYSQILVEKNLPPSRRPLCAVITGLPFHTSIKKLDTFFSDSGLKPDAFHITLGKSKECDGRAFVEFANFRDFDLALKLHGSSFRDNMVCVKQTLYDEMVKILDAVKAKHHFETPVRASTSDVPEKVPYLWEPPDAIDEQNKPNFHNSWVEDQYPYSSNSIIKKKFNPTMGHNTVDETALSDHFINNDRMPFGRNFDPHFKHKIVMKHDIERIPPYMTQNSSFNTKGKDFANDFREPIKFNVNKPSIVITKTNETFGSSQNVGKKSKLSKLSPEKEDTKVSVHKELKVSVSRTQNVDFKKISPERKVVDLKKFPERNKTDFNKKFPERIKVDFKKKSPERKVNFKKFPGINKVDFKKFPERNEIHFRNNSPERKEVDFKKFPERNKLHFRKISPERKEVDFKRKSPKGRVDFKKFPGISKEDFKKFPGKNKIHFRNNSPERKVDFKNFLERNEIHFRKNSPERKEKDFKRKSPERRDSYSQGNFKERRDDDLERCSRIGKHYKYQDTFSRNHCNMDSKQNYEVKMVLHHRSISPVNSSHSERKSKECIVHLSNVSAFVGTPDLVEFLREFVYYKDTVTRRYTDEGEPTGDVRVTFYKRTEAELAIRALNGHYLKGNRISMFIP